MIIYNSFAEARKNLHLDDLEGRYDMTGLALALIEEIGPLTAAMLTAAGWRGWNGGKQGFITPEMHPDKFEELIDKYDLDRHPEREKLFYGGN